VAVAANAEDLKKQIAGVGPSAIQYNSAKPADILAEDKIVGVWDLGLRPQDVEIVPVAKVFE
jgi:zinc protease